MNFSTKDIPSNNGTSFRFGANNLALQVEFRSLSKDGSTPKQIVIGIPDTYNNKIVNVPKQTGEEKAMPFNKFTFEDGAALKKGEMMSGKQADEFELYNFLRDISGLETAFGITTPTEGKTLTEFIENFVKAANGKKAWVKMVFGDSPAEKTNKYYLNISKERKGWISHEEAGVVPTILEIEHAKKAEEYNKAEPSAEHTSAPVATSDLPF